MFANPLRLIMLPQSGAGDRLAFESVADDIQGTVALGPAKDYTLATMPPSAQQSQIHPDLEAEAETKILQTNG